MKPRHLLIINDQRLYCFQDSRRGTHLNEVFVNSSASRADFSVYLASRERLPVILIVDCLEEFRVERVPRLSGKNRNSFLARKARQVMIDSRVVFQSLRRLSKPKREEEVLFIGLPEENLFRWCLEAVSVSPQPLDAIYTMSQIHQHLHQRLADSGDEYSLLFTHNPDSGTRQTFFHDGKVLLSRLNKGGANPDRNFFNQIREEVYATRQYLNNLKLIPRNVALRVHTLTSGASDALIQEALDETDLVTATLHRYGGLLEQLNLVDPGPESSLYLISAHLANRSRGLPNFARVGERKGVALHTVGNLIYSGGLAAAVGGVVLSMANIYSAWDLESRIQVKLPELNNQKRALREVLNRMPATPVEPSTMKSALEWTDEIQAASPPPETYLALAGNVLQGYPDLQLGTLTWRNRAVDTAEAGSGKTERAPSPFQIILEGAIEPFSGDYRYATDRIAQLTLALQTLPAVEQVEVQKKPVNTDPAGHISGSLSLHQAETAEQHSAGFSLLISLRKEP